jgi:rhamnosyltransferase
MAGYAIPAAVCAPQTLAAVITYNPDDSLQAHLESLRVQASDVLVIDNGSANVAAIAEIATRCGCILIRNHSNEGIAKALNQAAEFALSHGYRWLAAFDQDSHAAEGLVPGLVDLYERQSLEAPVGVVCALHVDRRTGAHYHVPQHVLGEADEWRLLRVAITSGSLFETAVFRKVGFFDESLFIDSVDHDFCMRCRQHGMRIIESKRHLLVHSLGDSSTHRLLWRSVVCSNHSALRRYYITRNGMEVYRRYMGFDFFWCLYGVAHLCFVSFLVLVYESDKLAKLRAMSLGVAHFFSRRFGPLRTAWASA